MNGARPPLEGKPGAAPKNDLPRTNPNTGRVLRCHAREADGDDLLAEARIRLEAVALILAHLLSGHADLDDVLPGVVRLVDQVAGMVGRAHQ